MTQRTLGVCYYPEHWPEGMWARDAARMAETGLTWVRIGEFAWSRMEPEPGRFDWGWLDRAIEVLHGAGLKVVLGTPTATPPRWMLDRHPDMLAHDAAGRPRGFGSRRHYCFSHDGYRAEAVRIATLLAERYGRIVDAWQTDNEYDCHDTAISYSPAAAAAFRVWLAQKYQSPQALNRAWGNVFWSMEYDDFAQIDPPNLTVTEPNPSHVLAFRRFSSEQVARFDRAQCAAIRAHSDAPIAHNFMGKVTAFDHHAVAAGLDIASWDSYPIGFLSDRVTADDAHRAAFLRQGDPDFQAFHHDLYRGAQADGRLWVMEQQPGPVNWAPWNPAPLPGMVRLWAWEAFAHGAETVCYFRWRQAPFAQEQQHAGLLRPDDAAAPGLAEAAQVARELALAPEAGVAPAPVALVFDYDSAFAWETQPQGRDFDYFDLCFDAYRACRRQGLAVDVVAKGADLSGYALVLAPGVLTGVDVPEGVRAIHGPRAGLKTEELTIPDPMGPGVAGATVVYVESIPPHAPEPLAQGGAFVKWVETLEGDGTVVEAMADGRPAMVEEGLHAYLAGWPDDAAFVRIVARAARAAGLDLHDLPPGLRFRDGPTHRIWWHYGAVPVAHDGHTYEPAEVRIEALEGVRA
ncbi:MAG: beta-galactosidase [Shimia sp.]